MILTVYQVYNITIKRKEFKLVYVYSALYSPNGMYFKNQ